MCTDLPVPAAVAITGACTPAEIATSCGPLAGDDGRAHRTAVADGRAHRPHAHALIDAGPCDGVFAPQWISTCAELPVPAAVAITGACTPCGGHHFPRPSPVTTGGRTARVHTR
jgi:hypothetical protein